MSELFTLEEHEDGFGTCMIVRAAEWTVELGAVANREHVRVLRLSHSAGWKGSDVTFVGGMPFLRGLEIYSWSVGDLSPLSGLDNLEFLGVQVDLKRQFDLSQLPRLKTVKLVLGAKFKGIERCVALEHANLTNYPHEDLRPLSSARRLGRFQVSSRKLRGLAGLEAWERLRRLDLFDCRLLESLRGVEGVHTLEELEVEACTRLEMLPDLGNLTSLTKLALADCGSIASLGFLRACTSLKQVLLTGSTNIVDGDLTPLKGLPQLESARFADRKHYNLRSTEFLPHG